MKQKAICLNDTLEYKQLFSGQGSLPMILLHDNTRHAAK